MSENQNALPETTQTCLCRLCLRDRQILMVRNYGNRAAQTKLLDELHEQLEHAEADNSYWGAVASGGWPSARRIAEGIIRRCDALEAAEAKELAAA